MITGRAFYGWYITVAFLVSFLQIMANEFTEGRLCNRGDFCGSRKCFVVGLAFEQCAGSGARLSIFDRAVWWGQVEDHAPGQGGHKVSGEWSGE